MIYIIKTETGIRARIWVDHQFQSVCPCIETLSVSVRSSDSSYDNHRSVAVELFLPKDADNYAFLGAFYKSEIRGTLDVTVNVSTGAGLVFEDHIAHINELVRFGIPEFYAKSITEFFVEKSKSYDFKSGRLNFYIGAHAEIGSSVSMFKKVCQILLELCEAEEVSESVIIRMLKDNLKTNSNIIVNTET